MRASYLRAASPSRAPSHVQCASGSAAITTLAAHTSTARKKLARSSGADGGQACTSSGSYHRIRAAAEKALLSRNVAALLHADESRVGAECSVAASAAPAALSLAQAACLTTWAGQWCSSTVQGISGKWTAKEMLGRNYL